mgnify:FL=1
MSLALDFSTNFDLDSESANFGYLVFTDNNPYAAAGYNPLDVIGYFKITGPLGVVRTGSFDSPDTDGSTSDWTYAGTEIPLISIDQYLLGAYTFEYFVQIGAEEFTLAVNYSFCPPTSIISAAGYIQQACESHTINSICNILTINNTTNYGDYTALTNEITLSPPALTSLPDVTANALSLTYTYTWVSVAYSIYINSLVTYVTGSVTVTVRVDLTYTISVSPAKLAAELMGCFVRMCQYYMAQAALKGGAYNLNPVLQSDMAMVGIYINEFNAATQIGEWVIAENLIPVIEGIISQYVACDCGCNTTIPRYVEPYCNCDGSGSGGSNLIFQATYPVVVTRTGDTIRYSLDPAFLASLEDLVQVTIESSDLSVDVGASPNYDLSVKNSLAFTATFLYSAGNDLSVTVANVQRQGTRYVSGYPVAADDIQVINYPHGSGAALEAEYAVFYVKDFLTTPPGVEISDKIDISEIIIQNAGASATDFSQASLFRMEVIGRTTLGFYFRLVDSVTGLAISVGSFIDSLTKIQVTIKINE